MTKNTSKLSLYGFGHNSIMGNFMLEGFCEVVPVSELVEKDGLKVDSSNHNEPMFMKLKIAKFVVKKRYISVSLPELVNQKREKLKI